MIKLFTVINGDVLKDLGDNTTPTYTRIHYLLNELDKFDDVEISSISLKHPSQVNIEGFLYNNLITKTVLAFHSALTLLRNKPMVYFAYPHSLTAIQNRIIFILCKLLNLKIILDIHDTVDQAKRTILNKEQEIRYFLNSDLLIFTNILASEYYKKEYNLNKNTVIIPNAFENAFIKLYQKPYKHIKNRFNICYVGGISKNRGVEMLVQACMELHDVYPDLKLYLFGGYDMGYSESENIKNIINKKDYIIIKEIPRKKIRDLFHDIDLFVMPYDPHNKYMNFSSPTKLFEYIGTGKPILCTKCESLIDIGKDNSIMYVNYNLISIKKQIEMLINNPQMREDMSKKLLELRISHTWKERANRLYNVMTEVR